MDFVERNTVFIIEIGSYGYGASPKAFVGVVIQKMVLVSSSKLIKTKGIILVCGTCHGVIKGS